MGTTSGTVDSPGTHGLDREAGSSVWTGTGERQVARPFTAIDGSDEPGFIDHWLDWFAAAEGNLQHPTFMPEVDIRKWRQWGGGAGPHDAPIVPA